MVDLLWFRCPNMDQKCAGVAYACGEGDENKIKGKHSAIQFNKRRHQDLHKKGHFLFHQKKEVF